MGNSINWGNQYKTKISKGNIKEYELVTVTKTDHYKTSTVEDKYGNQEKYDIDELQAFGFNKNNNKTFDIVRDFYGSQDELGNKDVLKGRAHISKNVRGSEHSFRFWQDCLYSSVLGNGYDYEYRELTDQEVIDILLDEILYDARPNLDSISCVGTTKKGIDIDPNYHDGHYFLPNNKDYTMTWCYGTVIIREGIDGGWYKGSNDVGRELFKGEIDWHRFKIALIKTHALREFTNGAKALELYPEAVENVIDKIKNDDKFKLNEEFDD